MSEVVGYVNVSGKAGREVEHWQHGRTKPREERNADMWALQRRPRNRSRAKPGGSSVVHFAPVLPFRNCPFVRNSEHKW